MLSPGARTEPVLFLIHDLSPGGAERVFLDYVRSIRRFRLIAVLVRRNVELAGWRPDPLLDLGPPVKRTDGSKWLAPALATGAIALFAKARRLRRLAARNDARLISTFLHKSHFIALVAKLLFDRRLRIVLNVHELLSQHHQHHFTPSQRPVIAWITRRYFPRADVIVAVAEGIKRDLVDSFGIPADRIVVVPNPLDLELIRRRAADSIYSPSLPHSPARMVVAVGRLVKLKGFDILLRAFARLPSGLGAHLVLVGRGDEHERLLALAEELGIADRVWFVGQQDNPWKFMARSDVLALSSWTEGFPNVIGEALALGLPVVATSCSPGVAEYLEDGRAGLLVQPGDVAGLAAALERVLTDTALRTRLQAHGPERVRPFDLPRIVEAYEAVLERVLRPA